ncbi:MAG TPA: L,D-transpeptidase family protein, partial [Gaiellaceae bacterium]|nr:L,D-transpeptidase family protein [Gaiellaceae bacterium]
MRRGVLSGAAALACLLAGLFSAAVLAANAPLGGVTTITLPTTTITTTTTMPTTTTRRPEPAYIAEGVSVGKTDVGGMTPAEATAMVQAKFDEALFVRFGVKTVSVSPARLGAAARVKLAIDQARRAAPNAKIPLFVTLRAGGVSRFVKVLARRFDRPARDAQLTGLRGLRPWITKEQSGKVLKRRNTVRRIVAALRRHERAVRIRAERIEPSVTRARYGPIVVIRRESKRLHLYRGMRLWKVFGVATGQSSYPTPIGRFSIVTMQRHPWWYPPDSDWAQGKEPIPPGPGNPLGTRWMGLSAPGVGMHGTPDAASIGYSASHGCIRMRIAEAEWLFTRVRVGTP